MEEVDVSRLMKPGVYILRRGQTVAWIGSGINVLAKIHAHAAQTRSKTVPVWMPARPIQFDAVSYIPCRVDQLEEIFRQACEKHSWTEPRLVTYVRGERLPDMRRRA